MVQILGNPGKEALRFAAHTDVASSPDLPTYNRLSDPHTLAEYVRDNRVPFRVGETARPVDGKNKYFAVFVVPPKGAKMSHEIGKNEADATILYEGGDRVGIATDIYVPQALERAFKQLIADAVRESGIALGIPRPGTLGEEVHRLVASAR